MELRWITITTLLLAIGVILRMVSPNIGGISLNWNIVMYCLAILLCRPTIIILLNNKIGRAHV